MQVLSLKLRMIWIAILVSEDGQDLPEYAFTVVMIALGAVAGMDSLAGGVNTIFSTVSTSLTTALQ